MFFLFHICYSCSFSSLYFSTLCSFFLMLQSTGWPIPCRGLVIVPLTVPHHCLSSAARGEPSSWCIRGCFMFHPELWFWHSLIPTLRLQRAGLQVESSPDCKEFSCVNISVVYSSLCPSYNLLYNYNFHFPQTKAFLGETAEIPQIEKQNKAINLHCYITHPT